MNQFKRILCVIDFTAPSAKALSMVKDMAELNSSELYTLNLISPASLDTEAFLNQDSTKANSIGTDSLIDKMDAGDDGFADIEDPAEAILHIAEKEDIGLIVMGNPDVDDMRGYFFGLVANKVTTLSDSPVFNVREIRKSAFSEEMIAPPMEQGG